MVVGLGTELVDVDRLRRDLDGDDREWLAQSFTAGERETCLRRVDPAPGLAARLAAKRAALTALGSPEGAAHLDVEIVRESSGKPRLELHGEAARAAEELGVVRRHVSLTHLESRAMAVVLLEAATQT